MVVVVVVVVIFFAIAGASEAFMFMIAVLLFIVRLALKGKAEEMEGWGKKRQNRRSCRAELNERNELAEDGAAIETSFFELFGQKGASGVLF